MFTIKLLVLVTWLANILGVQSISIEGQLTVIKKDCYERLAIGEKLSPKQTYKSFEHNTVSKCEKECTKEKEMCRAYSFGIGAKGNATCLLSRNPIKETADLKPIGTIKNTDYDLYIKINDCQVVLESPELHHPPVGKPNKAQHGSTATEHNHNQPDYLVEEEHHQLGHQQSEHFESFPAQSNYHSSVASPDEGYHYDRPLPQSESPKGDSLHHVQTLVSIASGANNILHPVHNILISGSSYGQGKPPAGMENGYKYGGQPLRPPFRPSTINHPYDNHKPEGYNDLPTSYGNLKPLVPWSPNLEYEYGYGGNKNPYFSDFTKPPPPGPHNDDNNYNRPKPDYVINASLNGYGSGTSELAINHQKYQFYSHYDSLDSETHKYGPHHPKQYDLHYKFYDHYERPNPSFPNRYGSVIPHPDDYNHPQPNYKYLFVRPNSEPDKNQPGPEYDRPNLFSNPRPGYGGGKPLSYEDFLHDNPSRPSTGNHHSKPNVGSQRPIVDKGDSGYDNLNRPSKPSYESLKPFGYDPDRSDNDNHFAKPSQRPNKTPDNDYNFQNPSNPNKGLDTYSSSRPSSTELSNHYGGNYNNKQYGKPNIYSEKGNIKVVSQNTGYNGEKITSIITELENACFHRTMAGKRAVRGLVRKLSICDTVEQCQQECGDERRFTCEGFNYRLDPSGRGKGECELLDLPLSRIDIIREIVPDHDYDLYTRDRNAGQVNCRPPSDRNYYSMGSYGGEQQYDNGEGNRGGRPYDKRPIDIRRPLRRPDESWEDVYGGLPRPIPPPLDRRPIPESNRRPEYGNRRGDYSYHHSHQSHSSHSHSYHYNEHNVDRNDYHQHEDRRPYKGIHYLPGSPPPPNERLYDTHRGEDPPKLHPVIIPLDDFPRDPLPSSYPVDRYPAERPESSWGLVQPDGGLYGGRYDYRNRYGNSQNHYYIPSRPQRPNIPADWGLYGGSYGIGNSVSLEYQGYGNRHVHDYWGLNKLQGDKIPAVFNPKPPRPSGTYLPLPEPTTGSYLPIPGSYDLDNSILPAEPRRPAFNFIKDECSLRTATGFRLHKNIVKKIASVPNILDCELLCVKEKAFPCASYAFRYTGFSDNCLLSNRNYKELDYYTDVQPDRDFDIYTMNNRHRCQDAHEPATRDDSECFWRVRSGQRLDQAVVRDSLTVKSIVDCQLECLKSRRFTCRAYSFRYSSPIIGGVIDNCQLTDCPFYELNPRIDLLPEGGFEVYERGSFGHGCEPNHFGIRGKHPAEQPGVKVDQLCYIGFGSAAKLLPQATVKSVYVPTELDCKEECSKAREKTIFRCMTFSFVTDATHTVHNCFLSNIIQRDLLPNVDYIPDPTSWLFTWDNYNPECTDLVYKPTHTPHRPNQLDHDGNSDINFINPLDVWKVYSVSGWPCKRGTFCKENRAAGFWYCELEGGDNNAWDYCCSPDHQCGFSNGYPYSWCYVGPSKTQWRKCSDQYFPYIHNVADRFDNDKNAWQTSGHYPPQAQSIGFRPDRPNAPITPIPPRPSLNEYEEEFDNEFLGPPKPGGFGQPRRWPVAYLHKEMPPNTTVSTDLRPTRTEKHENTKLSAIKSLIDVIQNTEIQNVQYRISNDSSKSDDILYVKIPLPNLDEETEKNSTKRPNQINELSSRTKVDFKLGDSVREQTSRTQKSLPFERTVQRNVRIAKTSQMVDVTTANPAKYPVFRRGFVTRTNVTNTRNF